jgi:hypothetical protein
MNFSDAGIEAFRFTMNCAIGTSLEKMMEQWISLKLQSNG